MDFQTIIYEADQGLARITLNRPEVMNALNREMIAELGRALEMAGNDPEVRVVVLAGGDKAFCTGMDLKFVREEVKTLADQQELFRFANRMMMETIENLPKPVVAVVTGYALAGGFELMLVCDLVIAAEDALIGDQHLNFGLVGPGGSTQRTPRIIGPRKAKELLFTGDKITGREAERIGLINRAVPAEELEKAVGEMAAKMISKSPVALKLAKTLINRSAEVDIKTGAELELMAAIVNATSEDYQEGLKAFAEKRNPVFKGR